MSETILKNAVRVYEACQRMVGEGAGTWKYVLRGSDIAAEAKMSRPTVRKHMKILVEQGICEVIGSPRGRDPVQYNWLEREGF